MLIYIYIYISVSLTFVFTDAGKFAFDPLSLLEPKLFAHFFLFHKYCWYRSISVHNTCSEICWFMDCPLQNPTGGWGLPLPFPWRISILIHAKSELSIILVYKTWLCIISWGISAWNMSKMKQRWRKDFCSLLFIVTKIVCKSWRICGYPEEEETSSVDQTPPFLSRILLMLLPLHFTL